MVQSESENDAHDLVWRYITCGDMPNLQTWKDGATAKGFSDKQIIDGIVWAIEQKQIESGVRIGFFAERAGSIGLMIYPGNAEIESCLLKAQESYEMYKRGNKNSPGIDISTVVHQSGSDEMIDEYNLLVSRNKELQGLSTKWYTDPQEIGKLRPRLKRSVYVEGYSELERNPGLQANTLATVEKKRGNSTAMDPWYIACMFLMACIVCACIIIWRFRKSSFRITMFALMVAIASLALLLLKVQQPTSSDATKPGRSHYRSPCLCCASHAGCCSCRPTHRG